MFDLKLGDPIDFELDFDLGDFNLVEQNGDEPRSRIITPRLNVKNVCQHVAYKNAREMARQIDLREGCRTFAWVSGDFIFGDLLEALILEKHISPKKIYICSLGMSQENIDSLENIIRATKLEQLTILLSGYFYSHEKERLIPYMYEHLDVGEITQVAFSNYHCKIIAVETFPGLFLPSTGAPICAAQIPLSRSWWRRARSCTGSTPISWMSRRDCTEPSTTRSKAITISGGMKHGKR